MLSQEYRIGEETQLHFLEPIGRFDMTRVSWILGNSKIVIELDSHFSRAFELLVVKPVDLSVGMYHVVDSLEVERVQQRLVEGDPDWHSIGKMSQEDLPIIHEAGQLELTTI